MMASGEVCGYDAIFDGDPERKFMCPICLIIMREAVQTSCGHRFCKECILKVASRRSSACKCPVDNTWFDMETEMFPDIAIQREILSLRVKCNQVEDGCTWSGELRNLEDHVDVCEYIETQCEFGCSRGRLLRGDVQRHLETCEKRPCTCEHCNAVMPYTEITRHQLLDCKKIPLSCTQCGQCGIQRGVIQRHLDADCPKVVTGCHYQQYGCNYRDKRDKMNQHEQEAVHHHLSYVENKVQAQDKLITEMDTRTNHLTRKLNMQRVVLDEKVNELRELQHSNVTGRLHWKIQLVPGWDRYKSPSFYTGLPGYKLHVSLELCGHVDRDQTYASLFVILEKGKFDDDLFFPFNGLCKAKVLSEAAPVTETVINCLNIPRCRLQHETSNGQRGRLRFMPRDVLLSEDYNTDNSLYIDIKVEV